MRKLTLLFFSASLLSCATSHERSVRTPANTAIVVDYPEIFAKSREVLANSEARQASRKAAESDLVGLLQAEPQRISESKDKLIEAINVETKNRDSTKHVRLVPPLGQWGYSDLKYYANHPYYSGGKYVPAPKPFNPKRPKDLPDLVTVWRNFLNQAQKSLVLNVYDFDLMEVAEDLVNLTKRGVNVRVGVDAGVIRTRPEVKQVADFLTAGGVHLSPVVTYKLNHQKMAAIDWDDPEKAQVLFSSGNLTQSCLGALGDLKDLVPRPKESIPNANHVITMKSWLLANLVFHELSKTLGPDLKLRPGQYPFSGAYQITGPGVDPQTLEAYPTPSLVIAFTPGGGFRRINENILARVIERTEGPVRLVQFAFSSEPVATALRNRAQRDFQNTGRFDFLAVGDTPFAMQGWSQFLKIAGYKREETEFGPVYVEDVESPWVSGLEKWQLAQVRRGLRVAPQIYGERHVKRTDKDSGETKSYKITSKIHHKLMSAGDFAVMGTSFNFSSGAESNHEQVLVFRDPKMVDFVNGVARHLTSNRLGVLHGGRGVLDEAKRRTRRSEQRRAKDDKISEAELDGPRDLIEDAQGSMANDPPPEISED